MSLVASFEFVLLLMFAVIVLELLAHRLHLPPAAALILGGIAIAVVPGTPEIELDPDLALVLFLPPLLLASAYFTTWRDFKANIRIILQLAVGAVLFTTLIVGWVAHLMVPGLPWAACFALGAIVSPPDAVAAKAVLAGVRLPPRIVVLLEGESLVNDASGLVLYRFAVAAAVTGTFSAGDAAFSFVGLSVGGCLAGVAFGWIGDQFFRRLHDTKHVIITSFLVAWAAYIVGEALHLSGVLATVACGLVLGWRQHEALSAAGRLQAKAVWDVVVFALESLVFVMIGLSMRTVIRHLGGDLQAAALLLPGVLAVTATLIVARFVWVFPIAHLTRMVSPSFRARFPVPPPGILAVMSWAGMRGVVSLAAALALPETFPGRDFILATTFVVICVTVLVQGTTLGPLIRMLGLEHITASTATTLPEPQARARIASVQLAEVERQSAGPDGTHRHPRLVEQYGYRARASARFSEANGGLIGDRVAHFGVVLAAVTAGRAELLRMHRAGEIHDEVLRVLEQELDLEEITARRFATAE